MGETRSLRLIRGALSMRRPAERQLPAVGGCRDNAGACGRDEGCAGGGCRRIARRLNIRCNRYAGGSSRAAMGSKPNVSFEAQPRGRWRNAAAADSIRRRRAPKVSVKRGWRERVGVEPTGEARHPAQPF